MWHFAQTLRGFGRSDSGFLQFVHVGVGIVVVVDGITLQYGCVVITGYLD